jgi:hypothetical protein
MEARVRRSIKAVKTFFRPLLARRHARLIEPTPCPHAMSPIRPSGTATWNCDFDLCITHHRSASRVRGALLATRSQRFRAGTCENPCLIQTDPLPPFARSAQNFPRLRASKA